VKPVRITPKADNDIDRCCTWIHNRNPAAALRFLQAVELTCDTLSQMPGIGSRRYADIPLVHGVRIIKVKGFDNYLLFYLEREASIDIIRLLHSAQDIPGALQSSE
jgi:toxin ParE1/3/4